MSNLPFSLQWITVFPQALLPMEAVTPNELTLLHFVFIAISILGICMGCFLIAYKKGHNVHMGIFTLALASILFELTLLWWDGQMHIPKIPFYSTLMFLLGPSLFLYIDHKIYSNRRLDARTLLLYYSPFGLSFIVLILLTNSQSIMPIIGFRGFGVWLLNHAMIKFFFSLYFLIKMVRSYLGCRKQIELAEHHWIKLLLYFFGIICVLSIARGLFETKLSIDNIIQYTLAYFFSVFIVLISFLLYLFPELVTTPLNKRIDGPGSREKYRNSGLTPAMAIALKDQLLASMETKVYLDHTLSLESLSKLLNTDRYSLSQVINQEFNRNFYEFVNDYRISECMVQIESRTNQPVSISDLIYESGFNNKVSFYKAFKKRNSVTPAQYIKALQDL